MSILSRAPSESDGLSAQSPCDFQLAEALIANDPGLQAIAAEVQSERLPGDKGIHRAVLLVTQYFITKYGHPDEHEQPTFVAVARQLMLTAAALTDLAEQSQPVPPPRAVYRDPASGVFFVRGKPKRRLGKAQAKVLAVLYEAGEDGLSKDKVEIKSGHSDWRGILKRLRDSDPDWASVIHFPGKAHGRYRIG
ncbi:MAG: hypothetical protein GXX96_17585 [Planctomycetaceae bacterium]|nr:hypothetical protein [Planctomycetaceae bacterium]